MPEKSLKLFWSHFQRQEIVKYSAHALPNERLTPFLASFRIPNIALIFVAIEGLFPEGIESLVNHLGLSGGLASWAETHEQSYVAAGSASSESLPRES